MGDLSRGQKLCQNSWRYTGAQNWIWDLGAGYSTANNVRSWGFSPRYGKQGARTGLPAQSWKPGKCKCETAPWGGVHNLHKLSQKMHSEKVIQSKTWACLFSPTRDNLQSPTCSPKWENSYTRERESKQNKLTRPLTPIKQEWQRAE